MKLRSVALVGVTSLAALGLIGVGAHAVFTTSTQSGQTITAGTGWGSTTGITDPGDPTVALTYPVNGTSYDGASWGRAITGTISDALGSITDLGVSVQQGSDPSSCWTGTASTFTATCPNYVAVATPTTTWSLNLAASYLTSGDTYNAVAKASDSTGNTFVSSSVSFTYNTAAPALPTVNITYPVDGTTYGTDWTGTITGSSLANETGQTISDVQVSIQQVGGSCWTGSGNDYTATCPNYVLVTSGTTSWSVTIPDTDLTNGDTYNLTAEATDGVGNLGTSSTVTFAHDTAVPSVAVIYPVDSTTYGADWTGTVTGTASSNSGDSTAITATALAIEDTTTDAWWNGTSFSNSTQSFETASGTTGWTLTLPASSLTSDNTYSVIAQATDSAGNLGTSPSVSFTYHPHTSPPTATITYPVNNATYGTNWNGTITGAASPSSGGATTITSVSVAIEDTTTGEWWNGTSFAGTTQSFVAATDTATWMLPFGTGNLTLGNTYSVIAQATDNLGNQGASSPVSFTYYVPATPPAATITYPVNNSTYGTSWTGSITGTATSGTGTTISGAQVAIENTATKKWWANSSFSSSTETFVPVSGTSTWYLGFEAASLTSGVSYTVTAQATDSLHNTGTSSTVSFTYNSSPPTVTVAYPVKATTYGANWAGAIKGTASPNAGAGTTVTSVSVAIEDTTTKLWWNGLSFDYTSRIFVAVTGTPAQWSLGLAAKGNLTSGNNYKVMARATDSLGNLGTSSTVTFTYEKTHSRVTKVYPSYMGDCGPQCSAGIYWTITGSDFVPGATVTFPGKGPSADFSVVGGSVKVLDSTTIVLRVRDTGAAKGKATVLVTDPGEAPSFGTITATGKPDPASLSIIGPSTVGQGAHTTLRLEVTGASCSMWGGLELYFSNPGITGGKATCSGHVVSVPITISSSALLGNNSVTLLVESKAFAISTNGLTVEVTRG